MDDNTRAVIEMVGFIVFFFGSMGLLYLFFRGK